MIKLNKRIHDKIINIQDRVIIIAEIGLNHNGSFSLAKKTMLAAFKAGADLVKFQNFKKKQNKINYLGYIITPDGIAERTKLTINFMKQKMKEYDELKKELEAKD